MRRGVSLGLMALLVPLFGCGGGGGGGPNLSLAPVSGVVKLDGKTLAGADVQFTPLDSSGEPAGHLAMGKTDDSGHYSLKTDGQNGAAVGNNRVSVLLIDYEKANKTGKINQLPAEYSGAKSTLKFTVPAGGSTEANFDLKSSGK
jgi:hypothetical protein